MSELPSKELVDRLRWTWADHGSGHMSDYTADLMAAADEIERLRNRVDSLTLELESTNANLAKAIRAGNEPAAAQEDWKKQAADWKALYEDAKQHWETRIAELEHDLSRAMSNHVADVNGASVPPPSFPPDLLLLINEAQNVVIDQSLMTGNTPARKAYLDGLASKLESVMEGKAVPVPPNELPESLRDPAKVRERGSMLEALTKENAELRAQHARDEEHYQAAMVMSEKHRKEVVRLQQERASVPPNDDHADAKRYRWLRARIAPSIGARILGPQQTMVTANQPEKLDELIDGRQSNTEGEVRVAPHVGPGGGAIASCGGETHAPELSHFAHAQPPDVVRVGDEVPIAHWGATAKVVQIQIFLANGDVLTVADDRAVSTKSDAKGD